MLGPCGQIVSRVLRKRPPWGPAVGTFLPFVVWCPSGPCWLGPLARTEKVRMQRKRMRRLVLPAAVAAPLSHVAMHHGHYSQ